MTYSTLHLVTQRLRQSASVVFTSILGLVVMASLVSCGSPYLWAVWRFA